MAKTTFSKSRKMLPIAICVLAIISGIILSLIIGGDTPVKKLFLTKVKTELEKIKGSEDIFKEEDISNLPEPVQRYFRYCGYIGKEQMSSAIFVWEDVNFKMGVDKPWIKIGYEQYNFVSEPGELHTFIPRCLVSFPLKAWIPI